MFSHFERLGLSMKWAFPVNLLHITNNCFRLTLFWLRWEARMLKMELPATISPFIILDCTDRKPTLVRCT